MENRRNYYRILHVQPDAPLSVIKASFRTIMQKLKAHPDLGGEHWNASLVNEAYNVLKNEEKRAEYDKEWLQKEGFETGPQKRGYQVCPFCKSAHSDELEQCLDCASPQFMTEHTSDKRRYFHRTDRKQTIKVFPTWPREGIDCLLLDLSPQGLCFLSDYPLFQHQTVKISCPDFDAIAEVRNLKQHSPSVLRVGAVFITCAFQKTTGTFFDCYG